MTYIVKWETLNGNVLCKRFTDSALAEKFYQRKLDTSATYGTQWVDMEAIS
jgi:hypothetical protein